MVVLCGMLSHALSSYSLRINSLKWGDCPFIKDDWNSGLLIYPHSSFIHSNHFYSASSSPLLLRSAHDTARILWRSFTPKRHRQLWVKDLRKVAARAGVEPTTVRFKAIDATNAPPRPCHSAASLLNLRYFNSHIFLYCQLDALWLKIDHSPPMGLLCGMICPNYKSSYPSFWIYSYRYLSQTI